MIVELDVGNSRIKWRIRTNEDGSMVDVINEGVAATVVELFEQLDSALQLKNAEKAGKAEKAVEAVEGEEKVEQVLLASVRNDDSLAQIAARSMKNWQLSPKLAVVSAAAAGVQNGYSDSTRLGVDRWLAMLAAWQKTKSACLVVDSGTALTIDAIADSGQHLGGYILPGLGLGLDALEANTAIRLQRRDFHLATPDQENAAPDLEQAALSVGQTALSLGKNTEAAVLNGVLAQAVAVIERVARQLAADARPANQGIDAPALPVLLSGGDAVALSQGLTGNSALRVEICPSLVLDGLALADLQELD